MSDWLTGPPNDDVDSDHLYNRMFYGLEEARWMIFNDFAENVIKKYQKPRRSRPFQTGQSFGKSWIEDYRRVDGISWKLEYQIKIRLHNLEIKQHYYGSNGHQT